MVVKSEQGKYYISDIEAEYRYEVTKQQYDNYMEMWEIVKLKLSGDHKSTPILYGTGDDMEGNNNDWSEWFYSTDKNKENGDNI